jgi:hypothetical protein
MATPITSSFISSNFQYPFLLDSQSSFFRFETKYQTNPTAICEFIPSYSIGTWPNISQAGPYDLNTFNGFPIGSPGPQTSGYRYQYGFDPRSNRECYRSINYFNVNGGLITDPPPNSLIPSTQGIPLLFYAISGSNGSVNPTPSNGELVSFIEEEIIITDRYINPSAWGTPTSYADDTAKAFALNWNGETGLPYRARFKSFTIATPDYNTLLTNYSTASFKFRIGIKANPDFPQRLYAGRLDVAFIMPRNDLPELTDPDDTGFRYYNPVQYSFAGSTPIPTITAPNSYADLTTYTFADSRQVFSAGSPGIPPIPIDNTYVPLVDVVTITDIEMGPGLSGSYISDTITINLRVGTFRNKYFGTNDALINRAFGLTGRFSFLTDPPVPPPSPSSQAPELWLVSIDPNGGIIPVQKINDTPLTTGSNSFNKTIQLSSSNLQVEDYRLGIAARYFGTDVNSPYFDSLNITSFNLTTTVAPQSNTPDEVILGSSFEENFTNNDWNALFGNAIFPRDSQYFMDIDYSDSSVIGSTLTPINFDSIIDGTAVRAPIQDYYYNLQRHTIPRYDGSRSNAPGFNSTSNDGSGYGDDIVAGNPKPFVGYYTSKGGSTPEVIGKTIINLDYIIDENLDAQVPALSDFTYSNQIQLFERDQYLFLDPDKNSIPFPLAGSTKYKIYRSGEFATPVAYSQTGSITAPYLTPTMSFFDSTGSQINVIYLQNIPYISDIYINQSGSNNTDFNDAGYPVSFPTPNEVFNLYSQGVPDPDPYLPDENTNPAYSASILGGTVGRVRLNAGLTNALNKNYLFKKVEGSGYYDTVDYFNLGPIYPEIATIPEYEIRFNADEKLVFPILSVFQTGSLNYADLYISVPANFEEIYGTFPIPLDYGGPFTPNNAASTRPRPTFLNALGGTIKQRFLIRRWVPRAGYIYLDVDAALGKGIVKPEFITKGIESKVSSIIKDLTDKGLITSTPQN